MADLVLHPRTAEQLQQYSAVSTHAILITGQKGSGKIAVAHQLATGLLQIKTLFEDYPYKLIISPLQHKAIGIAPIREVEHFLSLKVPNDRKINRVVLIEDSHTLTIEAQNALLKTLEEPPLGTVIIMTAAY